MKVNIGTYTDNEYGERVVDIHIDKWDTDEHWHKRWDYVLDCMIWSFNEIVQNDWEDQYWTTKPDVDWDDMFEEQEGEFGSTLKWKVEGVLDKEGYEAHAARIQQGLNLFAKYFQNLWS